MDEEKIEIDKLKVLSGEPIKISDLLTIYQPTIREIKDVGEQKVLNNNTLNNESQSFSKYKNRIKAKTKEKLSVNNFLNIKKSLSNSNKTELNSLNISKK